MSYIECKHIAKKFGKEQVLYDTTLRLDGGTVYGIVGRNGAGKTVLLKLMCGLYWPDSGTIEIDGELVKPGCTVIRKIGALIDSPGFLGHYSGLTNLRFLASIRGRITDSTIKQTLLQVGLDPGLKKHVRTYSLGMKQRLGIAQAIMEDPPILFLDEPMNGLDQNGIETVRKLILQKKKENKLVVLCTHIQEDLAMLCDVTYRISDHRIERVMPV